MFNLKTNKKQNSQAPLPYAPPPPVRKGVRGEDGKKEEVSFLSSYGCVSVCVLCVVCGEEREEGGRGVGGGKGGRGV